MRSLQIFHDHCVTFWFIKIWSCWQFDFLHWNNEFIDMSFTLNSFSTTFCHKDIMIRKNDYVRSSDLTTELSHRTRVRRDSLDLNNVSKVSRCWSSDIVAHLLITVSCILWSSVSGRSRSDSNEVLTSPREDLLMKNILIQIRSSFTTRLVASDLIITNVCRTLDATVFWLVSESVTMSSCQWMSNKFLIGEKLIENSYVLLWTGRVNFGLTNWLWTCHTSMCGDASCMTLQIYQKIWRYRGYFLQRFGDKFMSRKSSSTWSPCVERIRNISSEEDSNVVNSTEVFFFFRESDSTCIFQRSSNDF